MAIYTRVHRGCYLGGKRHPLTYVGHRRFQHGPLTRMVSVSRDNSYIMIPIGRTKCTSREPQAKLTVDWREIVLPAARLVRFSHKVGEPQDRSPHCKALHDSASIMLTSTVSCIFFCMRDRTPVSNTKEKGFPVWCI
jgi:hypothetical protein